MSSEQRDVTREALASVRECLGGPTPSGQEWHFEFGEHLESNWGAVYGGAVAAGVLSVARCVAPERSPRSLHLQLIRALPRGFAHTQAAVRHAGRTVATVQIDLFDSRRKLAATALVTMVTPDAVAADLHDTTATPFDVRTTPNPLPIRTPIHDSLRMIREEDGVTLRAWGENVRPSVGGTKAPIGTITVPWDDLESTGPESACLAADPLVGMAVYWSGLPHEVLGPNADLSLRFTTAPATRVLETSGTVLSVQHGTATVAIEVHAGGHQLAHGLSTALLIPPTS
jgi:acyl-coenzyme A thioesterase PaaI-like protein